MVEYLSETVPVAQLDRVLASEAEGCGFELRRAHHSSLEIGFFNLAFATFLHTMISGYA